MQNTLEITRKSLEERLLTNGYWDSIDDQKYGFKLGFGPYHYPKELSNQINSELGKVVWSYEVGVRKLFEATEKGKTHLHSNIKHLFRQSGFGLPIECSPQPLPLVKVDCMIDDAGNIKIAEIDGYNPRGIAYTSFLKDLYNAGEHQDYSIEKLIAKEVKLRGTNTLLWIYSHRERFYLRAIQQFKRIMKTFGIDVICLDAIDHLDKELLLRSAILIIPWGMRHGQELMNQDFLIDVYRKDPFRFLYPIAPWMGNKGFMAIASNATGDKEVEELAHLFPNLDLIRKYLPPTALAGKNFPETKDWVSDKHVVWKLNVSSGLKGVWFPDKGVCPPELVQALKFKVPSMVVQEHIKQKTITIYERLSCNTPKPHQMYTRIVAYVDKDRNVLDACLTGRTTPDVHGATDCILLPCCEG